MIQINSRLLSWASILDELSLAQAERTATMPFIHPHLALMPDAHLGKGATVGSVIPTLGAIIPAAVGVDIGCGMRAVRTGFTRADLVGRDLTLLRQSIERDIPLSAGQQNRRLRETAENRVAELESVAAELLPVIDGRSSRWRLQLGSLGSGNHFLEVTLDELDRVWLFLHSGSRGVGNRIAQHHIGVAQRLAEKWWIPLPDRDLAYLVEDTPEFDAYITELTWAQHFALLNRDEMMDRMIRCLRYWIDAEVEVFDDINCHHNYSASERHFGRQVWVSRKGAINAEAGRPGLVPGSMGTASFVVVGKGNPASLNSSPHGAGRVQSRSSARRTFTGDELRAAMRGIEYRDSDQFIDEIPAAYKPIERVMDDAGDLVEVVHELHQIVNVKGA
ncbi:RtcB family protein [Nakamurella deserti]|uniref:RtcB family protein n=1 Tax=Nakamurella deserti TaxID=2164074 RepID=UPI000DBE163D|nr:RtcB family protein [Nakamurella deserti]